MFNLKKENLAVNTINQKLDRELENHKQEEINLLNNNVRELLDLQEINNLGIAEEEKNKHRNIIINRLVDNNLNKLNELSNKFGSGR